ncbi:MAG TPA: hypothetical protein VN602_10715 [Gemmatimonadaceae bacterium]|nr:hypothetical protein [Gemmatimonadaceae bacterium]
MRISAVLLAVAVLLPPTLRAQDTTRTDTTKTVTKVTIPIDFSGVVFGNYQYQTAAGANKNQNKFDVERAYLTFKMPAGDRASIRVTGDLYQQTTTGSDSYYKGWVLRAKYAYLQYDFLKPSRSGDWGFTSRIGLLHTMFIDHEENFWPRWLSLTPVERAGYFSSADAGVAGIVTLPNKLGEAYLAVTNGSGYASRETDRFKDYQARLTITPLGNSDVSYLRTLAIDGWVYRGDLASKFVNGGTGQLGPIGTGLERNRYGGFVGIRDPRLVVGVDYAQRQDGMDTGANTAASPAGIADSTGRLVAGYVVAKPFRMIDSKSTIPLGIVLRYDQVTPNTSTSPKINTFIGGLSWDLTNKTSISLDYQEAIPANGAPVAPTKTYYMHWVANF